jgi:hypothetical protein
MESKRYILFSTAGRCLIMAQMFRNYAIRLLIAKEDGARSCRFCLSQVDNTMILMIFAPEIFFLRHAL